MAINQPVLPISCESQMIPHRLHSFLSHNSSLRLLSPDTHALFVRGRTVSTEVTIPPPTSAFMFELITLVRNAQRWGQPQRCSAYLYKQYSPISSPVLRSLNIV